MLLQQGQKVPFDISDFGIVFYEDSINLEQKKLLKQRKRTINMKHCLIAFGPL